MTQSAFAADIAGCAAAHDQQLVTPAEAALRVDLQPYVDPANPFFIDESEAVVIAVISADIAARGDKNGDGYVCADRRHPVNRGTDRTWGVTNYQLLSVSDNNSVGRA